MKSFLFFAILLTSILFSSCGSAPKNVRETRDTCVVAYNQGGQYLFNKAIVWTHMGRKFKSDSGLDAEMGPVTQFALRLPTIKSDSIMDSVTHRVLRINDRYSPAFLPDSLSHYLHIIDTLH